MARSDLFEPRTGHKLYVRRGEPGRVTQSGDAAMVLSEDSPRDAKAKTPRNEGDKSV
jgi:hypothetical protein